MGYYCVCDGDQPSLFSEREIRSARKQHKCDECQNPINVGESYRSVFGVWDGMADSHRLCSYCVACKEYVEAHLPCFCWYWGSEGEMLNDMRESVSNYSFEVPGMGMEFGRLYVKAIKPKWRRRAD